MIQHSTVAAFVDDHGLQAIGLLFVWATFLLVSAWIIAGLLRRASSAVRYCVWQFALMGLLTLPAVFAVLPGIPLGPALMRTGATPPSRDARLTNDAAKSAVAPGLLLPVGARSLAADGPMDAAHSAVALKNSVVAEARDHKGSLVESLGGGPNRVPGPKIASRAAMPVVSWSALLVGIWALGVVVQLAWLVRCVGRAGRSVRRAVSIDDLRDFANSSRPPAPALAIAPRDAAHVGHGMHSDGGRCSPPKYSAAGKLRALAGGKDSDGVVARAGAR